MSKQTQKKNITTANVKATFLFAALIAAFIIAMGMINFTGIAYAAESTLPDSFIAKGTAVNPSWNYINGIIMGADIAAPDGTQLYCLEHDKAFPLTDRNITYTKNNDTVNPNYIDDGIVYILSQGYNQNPNFAPSLTPNEAKYVTQIAIWYYQCLRDGRLSETDPEGPYLTATQIAAIKADSKYGSEVAKLAEGAKSEHDHPTQNTITVNTEGVRWTVNGKYLETSVIKPEYTGYLKAYKVVLPENTYGARVVDENGKEISSSTPIAVNKGFKVQVEISKVRNTNKIDLQNVVINGTFEERKAYSYSPTSGDHYAEYQVLLYAAWDSVEVSTDANFHFDIKTGPVKISKTDITNSAEVPGATLVIKDCTGATVASWVSGKEPHYIDALPYYGDDCKYSLTETIAPTGYAKSSTTVQFNVKPSGEVTSVVMTNTPTTKSPDTGSNIPWFVYLIGILAIGAGIVVVATNVYEQKQKA